MDLAPLLLRVWSSGAPEFSLHGGGRGYLGSGHFFLSFFPFLDNCETFRNVEMSQEQNNQHPQTLYLDLPTAGILG